MRKLKLLTIAVSALLLASCGNTSVSVATSSSTHASSAASSLVASSSAASSSSTVKSPSASVSSSVASSSSQAPSSSEAPSSSSEVSSIQENTAATVAVDPNVTADGVVANGKMAFKNIQNAVDFLNELATPVTAPSPAARFEDPVSSQTSSITLPNSSAASSEETTTIVTKVVSGDYKAALTAASASVYELNSVFALMPGVITDSGSKNITVDGTTFASGGRIKLSGSGSMTAKAIRITSNNAGGVLRFVAQGANSTDTTRTWTVADQDGTELFTSAAGVSPTAPEEDSYTFDKAGTYYLYSKINGINFYYLDYTQKVALGTETGFSINTNTVKKEYLVGDVLNTEGVVVSASYSSGATKDLAVDKYTIDVSAVNMNVAGTYSVKVKYGTYADQTYDVVVHAVKGLKSYTGPIMESGNSKKVHHLPKVYLKGGAVDTSKIVVKAVTDADTEMILNSSAYTVGTIDTSTAGVKTIPVSYVSAGTTYNADISVTVIDPSALALTGVLTEGTVEIADGTYTEKLYVETPNITLKSASGEASKVIIQSKEDADSIDPAGAAWSTYGSGSVTVTAAATNFMAKDLTIKNAMFETMADYKAVVGNLQACALVCSADKSSFYNCSFVGFQDTLYANAGSQYYQDCCISGMTDFIFGETNNAVFNNCAIMCKDRGDTKNNGYICAPKPSNLTATDVGFVFMNCIIAGEDGEAAHTVSLARPWGATAKCTYYNCAMGEIISTSAYPCTTNNARWEIMSGNKPDKASFAEYGNSGDGAITEAVAGGKIFTADEYAAFDALVKAQYAWTGSFKA